MLSHWFILIGFGFSQQQSELILLSSTDSAPFVLPFIVSLPFILFDCQSSVSLGLQVISNPVGCYNPAFITRCPGSHVPSGPGPELWFDREDFNPFLGPLLNGGGGGSKGGQGLGNYGSSGPREGSSLGRRWGVLCAPLARAELCEGLRKLAS